MPSTPLVDRILRASSWWIVRAERGTLWEPLFKARGVVAHGRLVPRFSVEEDYAQRQLAMNALDDYGKREVNDFIDEMDLGHVVVTPNDGSSTAWFGLVSSEWFADESVDHWIQRRCEWLDQIVPLDGPSTALLQKGQMGTVFPIGKRCELLRECLRRVQRS